MADYSIYQGPVPEWENYVKTTGYLNPSTQGVTPLQLRSATNAGRVETSHELMKSLGLYEKVMWQDHSILTRDQQNIIARVYRPRNLLQDEKVPVVLHFHGGGFLYGNVESEDASCSRIVAGSGTPLIVVSVNYRHTPEHVHPTQIEDAWDAYLWLSKNISALGGNPQMVVVTGVSAGGGLAASTVVRYCEQEVSSPGFLSSGCKILGQVLCIPWLVHPDANPLSQSPHSSYNSNKMAPVLPLSALSLFASLLGESAKTDSYFNIAILPDEKLVNLPKTAVLVAGQDLLRDEGLYYAERLKQNGVPTNTSVFPGLPHGFRRFSTLPSTQKWEETIVTSIEWCFSEDTVSTFSVK